MRPLLSTAIPLAFLTVVGLAACTDAGNNTTTTSTPPARRARGNRFAAGRGACGAG